MKWSKWGGMPVSLYSQKTMSILTTINDINYYINDYSNDFNKKNNYSVLGKLTF